jgi:hypothetical protein
MSEREPMFSRPVLVFLLAVPVGWAALLAFHPNPTNDIHAGLHGQSTRWLVVHLGTLVFIGLMGVVLQLLVRGLPGLAASVARWAVLPYVLFYGSGEAIIGVATGVVVRHADGLPESERSAAAGAAQVLWTDLIAADVIIGLGGIAWIVAVVAAGVALRQSGAPLGAAILVGAAAIAVIHTWPFAGVGLGCLAAGITWIGLQPGNQEAGPAQRTAPPAGSNLARPAGQGVDRRPG